MPSTIESRRATPPAAIVRARDGRILGYAFSTREVSGSVGYSGRPLDIVAAVTPEGIIAGAEIVAHEEPILVIGIPREALAAYVANFKGFDVRASAGLQARAATLAAAAGRRWRTVTSAVIRDAIVRSARAVLRSTRPSAEPAAAAARPRDPAPVVLAGLSPKARCGAPSPAARPRGCSAPGMTSRTRPSSNSGWRWRRRRRSAKACSASASTKANSPRSDPTTISC